MDNHLHVLLRLDPDTSKNWSDEEVVRRRGKLFFSVSPGRPSLLKQAEELLARAATRVLAVR